MRNDCVTNADECDDTDATINPGADEACDGVDKDCDHQTDERGEEMCNVDHRLVMDPGQNRLDRRRQLGDRTGGVKALVYVDNACLLMVNNGQAVTYRWDG